MIWRKSTRCGANGACVEVARVSPGHVGVRDSKDPAGVLVMSRQEFGTLLDRVKQEDPFLSLEQG